MSRSSYMVSRHPFYGILIEDWKVKIALNNQELNISEEKLHGYVQKIIKLDEFELGEWSCNRLNWKASNEVTGGLYRLAGAAVTKGGTVPWSVILKMVVPVPNADNPGHYNYWKREVLAYQSGVLEKLPKMVRAPQCFAVEEREDHTVWLWLEEVTDSTGSPWTKIELETAVRLLGTLGGAYLTGEPLPDEPWLCKRWLASWVEECDRYDDGSALIEDTWRAPALSRLFPAGMFGRYKEFHQTRALLLDGLRQLPRMLTHNDAWPPNLFLQANSRLVAIDWAFVGIAGLGEELGRLYGLILHMGGGAAADPDSLFEPYMAGLKEAGWHGDPDLVRFGFTASAGIRCGMVVPKLVDRLSKRNNEDLLTDEMKERSRIAVQLLELAEEAQVLLRKLTI
ncbi:MAG: aminoglycoside phosphotransferase [Paenibacillus sp.]|nr:aminoglycoside phosphotransferase [Paenibacillus sp.]